MLSKPAIMRHLEAGRITIDPFIPENVGSAQVDVTLGEYFYREKPATLHFEGYEKIYNPFDEKHVTDRWQLCASVPHSIFQKSFHKLEGVGPNEGVILLHPGEMILAHTEEFIGGSCDHITTQMKARSTIGRNFLTVCACAGQGDVGYFNRWTFEIHNRNQQHYIPIVRRRRIAQILFFETEPVAAADVYGAGGKYQKGVTLDELKANWKPEDMLPKMYFDRESKRVQESK